MPYKSFAYYLKTIQLKATSAICHKGESLKIFNTYKRKKQKIYSEVYQQEFKNSLVNKKASFPKLHLTYCHFNHPNDLGRHLIFNEKGIAMCRSDTRKPFHNPFFSAYYALVCYNHYIRENDNESHALFWNHVHFLEKAGHEKQNMFLFNYTFDYPKFGLKSPWISALTQAAVLSVFIRASFFEGERRYEKLIDMLCKSLFHPVEEGGVLRTLAKGENWLEEYPSNEPDLTLNGFVFCIVSLYEYYHYTNFKSEFAKRLQPVVRALFYQLHRFIFGKYTKYGMRSAAFHNIEYQGFFVCLFLHLWKLSGKNAFRELALHFERNMSWERFYSFYGLNDQSQQLVLPFFDEE